MFVMVLDENNQKHVESVDDQQLYVNEDEQLKKYYLIYPALQIIIKIKLFMKCKEKGNLFCRDCSRY